MNNAHQAEEEEDTSLFEIVLPSNYLVECYGPKEISEEVYLARFSPKGAST